jgi:trigger factor
MEKLLDHHTIEAPKVLVEEELKRIAENWKKSLTTKGITPDKIPTFPRDEFISQAERNVALGLLFAHVVKEGNITVSQAEVRKKIEELMSNYYEDNEEMINKCLADISYVQEMKTLLLEEKVVEYLSAQMTILDKVISYKEAMERK